MAQDGTIAIEFGAVENVRTGCGWLPMLWENGHARGDTYAARGFDRSLALSIAQQAAHSHAARFVGDWTISICERAS